MGRPIERIKPILKIIEEAWLKNPDLRLVQLLGNTGANGYSEDVGELVTLMSEKYGTTPLIWGTYGEDGKSPLKYLPLEEMETLHLANILQTQNTSERTAEKIKNEILKRTLGN